jgi:hypothetical protein
LLPQPAGYSIIDIVGIEPGPAVLLSLTTMLYQHIGYSQVEQANLNISACQ